MIIELFLSILLTESRKLIHDCLNDHFDFDEYSNESYDYSISCTNDKNQYINLSYPNQNSKLSILQSSNVYVTCSKINQQKNTLNLSIYGTPNITFQNNCNFNNIEINGNPIFNFVSHSHVSCQNLILNNFTNHFFAKYISFKTPSNTTKNKILKSDSSLLEVKNNMTFECQNYEMKIILAQNANVICENSFDILLEYIYFSRINFYVHDNYVNFLQTNFNAKAYMKTIFSSLRFDNETNVIFSDYREYEIDNFIGMFDLNKLNIVRTMVYRYDPDYQPLNEPKHNVNNANKIYWERAIINGHAYYYGVNGSNDEIIEIKSSTKKIIILVIVSVIVFLVLSNCFIAQFRYYIL